MNNMGSKEFTRLNKIMNTIYGYLIYITDEDMLEINHIDDEILDINRILKNYLMSTETSNDFQLKEWTDSIWGKDSKASHYADVGQGLFKIFSAIAELGGYKPNDMFNSINKDNCMKLVQKRRKLTEKRQSIIFGAKSKMKNNEPETYKIITNQLKNMQLEFSKGEFDITKLLMPNLK